ncbi:hypothetical protein CANARDRAFT_27828 [[Candida] arabinofermentans NRRL YB-2248]|uniref:C2H2-type domain-containing protein n=1 Tax=[Candida] arabinofermentans NRRL YB-2248 TaxID=983967 RepID=A0A1E4T1V3_9ASCO|nr:hypothetical protein CANARDRAFT_27828 [[Candida] arabinofermentans NRRL YB-2248]
MGMVFGALPGAHYVLLPIANVCLAVCSICTTDVPNHTHLQRHSQSTECFFIQPSAQETGPVPYISKIYYVDPAYV